MGALEVLTLSPRREMVGLPDGCFHPGLPRVFRAERTEAAARILLRRAKHLPVRNRSQLCGASLLLRLDFECRLILGARQFSHPGLVTAMVCLGRAGGE